MRRFAPALGIVLFCLAAPGSALAQSGGNISIDDVSVTEGNSGTTSATFTVTCDTQQCTSSVDYTTNDGSAQAPADYQQTSGTLNFDNSVPSLSFSVPVNGDTAFEGDEAFNVTLTLSSGSDTITDGSGQGTIRNDDQGPPGDRDGDGVPDSSDACPTVPANTPNGCPPGTPPDADGDGVPDSMDICPNVPANTPNGCPAAGGNGILPPPTFGATVNLYVVEDDVFYKPPAGTAAVARAGAARRRKGFIPLIDPAQVPVGSLIDTTDGRVRVQSARDITGGTQSGRFAGGLFQVRQARRAGAKTELRLRGSSFRRRCRARSSGIQASAAGRRRLSKRTVRRLSSNAKGNFRTRGRHSAATVRGTVWTTTDRCDGTLTKVSRGSVRVRDFGRRRSVVVRAGQSYLARAG